jgi:hypothetical protein
MTLQYVSYIKKQYSLMLNHFQHKNAWNSICWLLTNAAHFSCTCMLMLITRRRFGFMRAALSARRYDVNCKSYSLTVEGCSVHAAFYYHHRDLLRTEVLHLPCPTRSMQLTFFGFLFYIVFCPDLCVVYRECGSDDLAKRL